MKNLKIKIPGEKDCKNPEEIEALLERKYIFFQKYNPKNKLAHRKV